MAHFRDIRKAARLLEKAERLREGLVSGRDAANPDTEFYFGLYGNRAPEYIDLEIGRMGTLQLYQYMATAYHILGDGEKAARYGALFAEELEKAKKKE